MTTRLEKEFFARNLQKVAADLLGKVIVHKVGSQNIEAVIIETEAYSGEDDSASHAFKGKTKRNWPMFGEAGLIYVYLSYGIHYCVNIVVGKEDEPAAVLIRSVILLPSQTVIRGPGRTTKALKVNLQHNGTSAVNSTEIWLEDRNIKLSKVEITSRIGISKATEKLWRYVANEEVKEKLSE